MLELTLTKVSKTCCLEFKEEQPHPHSIGSRNLSKAACLWVIFEYRQAGYIFRSFAVLESRLLFPIHILSEVLLLELSKTLKGKSSLKVHINSHISSSVRILIKLCNSISFVWCEFTFFITFCWVEEESRKVWWWIEKNNSFHYTFYPFKNMKLKCRV